MGESRVRFSINLDEDFALYGIDPNEDLDDWSFLEAKHEPIPEKTEEEKRLFEQLLQPTINEEDIENDINGRLKRLLDDTSQLIESNENDPILKEKLNNPQEEAPPTTPEIEKERINTPEYVQANRVRSIVKNLLASTSKAEDISDFINEVTKSDKVELESIEVPPSTVTSLLPGIPILDTVAEDSSEKADETNAQQEQTESKPKEATKSGDIPPLEQKSPPKKTNFFSRYVKKLTEPKAVLKDLDETERLSSKFEAERKRREEEAEKEAERKRKELEEKSNKFFENLQKEAERRAKERAEYNAREEKMAEEIKNSKPVSVSEMLSNIKGDKKNEKPDKAAKPNLLSKAKQEKEVVKRASEETIAEFAKQRAQKLKEAALEEKPVLVVDLLSERQRPVKMKSHESKTFVSNLTKALKEALANALSGREARRERKKRAAAAIKIAIFIKLCRCIQLQKKSDHFRYSNSFRKWKALKNRKAEERRKLEEVAKAQKEAEEKRRKEMEQKKREEEERIRKAEEERRAKAEEILRKQQEENKKLAEKRGETDAMENARRIFEAKMPGKKRANPVLNASVPDLDEEWLNRYVNEASDSDFEDFLNDLKDHAPVPAPKEVPPKMTLESKSVPISGPPNISEEISESDIAKAREELKKKMAKVRSSNQSTKSDARSSVSTMRDSQPTGSPIHQNQPQPADPRRNRDNDLAEQAVREGYGELNEETLALMQRARNRHRTKNYKNEKPVDRFKRLYGFSAATGANDDGTGANVQKPRVITFRHNDTRSKRLQKLQQAWFAGERAAARAAEAEGGG